jgi:hypothetical protein
MVSGDGSVVVVTLTLIDGVCVQEREMGNDGCDLVTVTGIFFFVVQEIMTVTFGVLGMQMETFFLCHSLCVYQHFDQHLIF